eukprot:gene7821-13686_t
MASDRGKWETVVTKKKGQVSKSDVKKAKKNFVDNFSQHKAEFKNPLEEAETIYSAAFGEKSSQSNKENNDPDSKYPSFHPMEGQKKGTQQNSPKKQKQKKHKIAKPSPLEGIEDKIKELSLEELSLVISNVEEKFPNHSLVWLKEVASWLQKQFPGPAEKDLMLSSQPKGFPLCSVDSDVKKALLELLKKSTDQSIEMLFCYCITKMIEELQQGKLTIGLRILIQVIVSHSPKVLITKLDDVLSGKSTSQESFLAVIWAYSQNMSDFKAGIKVWWAVMMPLLKVSTHAPHVVQYIEDLIRKHEKGKINDSMIDAKEFYEILVVVFSSKSQLANSPRLKERFDTLYPTFKRMYFSDKPEGTNRNKFKRLLTMLMTDDDAMQAEKFPNDVKCPLQSGSEDESVLWGYIYDNSEDVRNELLKSRKYASKNVLQEKAFAFLTDLRHIKRKGHGSKVGFAECYEVCSKFQSEKMTRKDSKSSLWKLTKYTLFAMLAFIAIDVYTSKGYKGSRTESIAVNAGINSHVEASLVQLEGMVGVVARWSRDNVPKYYAKVAPYVDPVIETSWEYTTKISKAIYEYSKPALDVISKYMEKLFEKIDELMPVYRDRIVSHASTAWNAIVPTVKHHINCTVAFITTNVPIAVDHTSRVLTSTCTWVYELYPPFFDKMAMHSHCALHCVRDYVNKAWQTFVDYGPVAIELSVDSFRLTVATLQSYFADGQLWLQNALRY